jgi:hypothetical protein
MKKKEILMLTLQLINLGIALVLLMLVITRS